MPDFPPEPILNPEVVGATATDRIAKFLDQWSRGRAKNDVIYGMQSGEADEAILLASDLRSLISREA